MLYKTQSERQDTVWVTFSLTSKILAGQVHLVGDFNDWDPVATPMRHDQARSCWTVTLSLAPGRSYCFRYLIDSKEWLNDWHADDFVENPYGSYDSVVDLSALGVVHGGA
ncbi:MAG: isoamylase early set domain-containing protein [Anaerolineae bacterium]